MINRFPPRAKGIHSPNDVVGEIVVAGETHVEALRQTDGEEDLHSRVPPHLFQERRRDHEDGGHFSTDSPLRETLTLVGKE